MKLYILIFVAHMQQPIGFVDIGSPELDGDIDFLQSTPHHTVCLESAERMQTHQHTAAAVMPDVEPADFLCVWLDEEPITTPYVPPPGRDA